MIKNKFVFDVDGTLTPSRQPINAAFGEWFLDFCKINDVYLVSGSDYDKTLQQLGKDICYACKTVFSCSGNDVWEKGININFTTWKPYQELLNFLEDYLSTNKFPVHTGKHFELRKGCLNFSILGRDASLSDRAAYVSWDLEHKEREKLVKEVNAIFKTITATIGGETGIDIYPTGRDKSQILKYFNIEDKLYFFADKTEPGGNDYPLAKKIKNTYTTRSWGETWETLLYFRESGIAV
jgi:phosphomannomutase